jgi:hypothetical protein
MFVFKYFLCLKSLEATNECWLSSTVCTSAVESTDAIVIPAHSHVPGKTYNTKYGPLNYITGLCLQNIMYY